MTTWRIDRTRANGKTYYRAYRLFKVNKPDEKSNRLYHGEWITSYSDVLALVDYLNEKGSHE